MQERQGVQVGIRKYAKATKGGTTASENTGRPAARKPSSGSVSLSSLLGHTPAEQQPAAKKARNSLTMFNQSLHQPAAGFHAADIAAIKLPAKVKQDDAPSTQLQQCSSKSWSVSSARAAGPLDAGVRASADSTGHAQATAAVGTHSPHAAAQQQHKQRPKVASKVLDSTLQAQHGLDMAACPLCGVLLPPNQLQQHVDAELQELEDLEQQQQQGQQQQQHTGRQHQQGPGWQQQQQQQRWQSNVHQQHQQPPPQQQEQQGQQHWQGKVPQHQQQHWQGNVPQHQQQQRHDQHRWQQEQHLHKQQKQQHRQWQAKPQQSNPSSSVTGLRMAPSKPRSADEPAPVLLDTFDYWGDSSSNWLDDSMIGIEGAPRSAGECWEGVGRCVIGPRTMH